jgi:hypothetical protein
MDNEILIALHHSVRSASRHGIGDSRGKPLDRPAIEGPVADRQLLLRKRPAILEADVGRDRGRRLHPHFYGKVRRPSFPDGGSDRCANGLAAPEACRQLVRSDDGALSRFRHWPLHRAGTSSDRASHGKRQQKIDFTHKLYPIQA